MERKLPSFKYNAIDSARIKGDIENLDLTNEEMALSNFCESIYRACLILNVIGGSKYNDGMVAMLMESLRREVVSCIKKVNGKACYEAPKKSLFNNEFMDKYVVVVDFILAQYGLRKKSGSIIDSRKSSGKNCSDELEGCKRLKSDRVLRDIFIKKETTKGNMYKPSETCR